MEGVFCAQEENVLRNSGDHRHWSGERDNRRYGMNCLQSETPDETVGLKTIVAQLHAQPTMRTNTGRGTFFTRTFSLCSEAQMRMEKKAVSKKKGRRRFEASSLNLATKAKQQDSRSWKTSQ